MQRPPVDEPTLSLEPETEFTDPEFVLVEEVRYPVAEQEATLEPENLDLMTDKSGTHLGNVAESVVEREDVLGREMRDTPDDDLEADLLPCPDPTSEGIGAPTDEPEVRLVPAPRKRKERNVRVDTPIPPPRRSRRTTAGKKQKPV